MRPPAFVDCYGDLEHLLTPQMLEPLPELEVFRSEPSGEDELIERLQERHHALVYMGYLSENVLASCPDLRTVAYLSTGLATRADLAAADRLGIRIEGVKAYGDRAVAEHAVLMMLASLRQLVDSDRRLREGKWGLVRSQEIACQTIGILGFGGIGRETARLCHLLDAEVLVWSRSSVDTGGLARQVNLEELLQRSDILSMHLSLNEETTGFLNHERMAKMKPGAILVNTARAATIDEHALVEALDSGRLSHAALDVFHEEPPASNSPLLSLDNTTLTPHSAWYTDAAISRLLIAGLALMRKQIDNGTAA